MSDDMRPVEDELRAAFARYEELTPEVGPVREAIAVTATRRRRRRRAVRATGAAFALFAVLAVPFLGRGGGLPQVPEVAAPPFVLAPTGPAEPLDFLLLGLDGGDGRSNGHRADTVLLVHVPADRSRLYLISIPRDLGVEIPDHGFGKLGSAFYLGSHRPGARPDLVAGAELTERAVGELTGVRFDATATLTYRGLREVTDAVGGVRVCLPEQVSSRHTDRVFRAGCQQLDGAAAQDLLRQRFAMPEGAHDRDRNGQRFVEALLHKVTDPATALNPVRAAQIVDAAGGNLVLDLGGLTVPELYGALRGVAAADAVGIGWTVHPRQSADGLVETLDAAEAQGLFEALRRDTVAEWAAGHPQRVTR
ncbi:LCP family protein [Plantactinospora sonchi]|uniref:LCP family protein n=1 Tax=Plantactinospora sonchi TaxID=1544735 RepID=A0ABU7RP65_9ACTN